MTKETFITNRSTESLEAESLGLGKKIIRLSERKADIDRVIESRMPSWSYVNTPRLESGAASLE